MKKTTTVSKALTLLFSLLLCTCLLSSCSREEHDGIEYFKKKCTAQLNGQSYIDQTPFYIIFSPGAMKATPWFVYGDGCATFRTDLSTDRESNPDYRIEINFFYDTLESSLHEEQTIEKVAIECTDPFFMQREYMEYCINNRLSYALVNTEVVEKGTFRILSYDEEKGKYKGTFTLLFSEGTLKGEFDI